VAVVKGTFGQNGRPIDLSFIDAAGADRRAFGAGLIDAVPEPFATASGVISGPTTVCGRPDRRTSGSSSDDELLEELIVKNTALDDDLACMEQICPLMEKGANVAVLTA